MKSFDDMTSEPREHLEGGFSFVYSDGESSYRVRAIPGEKGCYALVARDAKGTVVGSKIAAGFGELAYAMQGIGPLSEWRTEGG